MSSSLESSYLESLSPLERSVCTIAESHLQSSFDLSRSSGFIAWKSKHSAALSSSSSSSSSSTTAGSGAI